MKQTNSKKRDMEEFVKSLDVLLDNLDNNVVFSTAHIPLPPNLMSVSMLGCMRRMQRDNELRVKRNKEQGKQ
jgi:hypothetical protein